MFGVSAAIPCGGLGYVCECEYCCRVGLGEPKGLGVIVVQIDRRSILIACFFIFLGHLGSGYFPRLKAIR